jgi:hypothetical protein
MAEIGNFLAYPWPNLWVKALSFINDNVVFTAKTDKSFEIAGSIQGTIMWSAKLEVIYVAWYTSKIHLN